MLGNVLTPSGLHHIGSERIELFIMKSEDPLVRGLASILQGGLLDLIRFHSCHFSSTI